MRAAVAILALLLATGAAHAAGYVPPAGDAWAKSTARRAGFDPVKLQAAIDFAIANETRLPAELAAVIDPRDLGITNPIQFSKEPYDSPIGPFQPRVAANGLVMRHGRIVAEWGDTRAADMTFSVTKTFLSLVAGVAFDRRMIRDVNDRVIDYVQPAPDFLLEHNRPITWDHMLRQTSGWTGTMWGKPWWADRPGEKPWSALAAGPPPVGTAWEYNDVRVNAFALALTHLWKRPLPDVLRETVMEPIGASETWHWEGYENSWTMIDGRRVLVVPGGGHWGGGMFISARDLGRVGLLALNNGAWGKRRLLSEDWIRIARTPTSLRPDYGYMNWFLNTDRKLFPAAREDAVAFLGNGTNMVFLDYQHDTVAVVRWIDDDRKAEFVRLLEAAIRR